MTLTEKAAYIKGLVNGLKLDENKDEVKVLNAIIELLDSMALSVADLEDCVEDMEDRIVEIDEDLADLEEDFEDVLEDEFGCDCDFDNDEETEFYEVTCPVCGEEICVEEDVLLCGETKCPKCGEDLEFDFSSLVDDCDDDCGCGCHHHTDDSEDLMS